VVAVPAAVMMRVLAMVVAIGAAASVAHADGDATGSASGSGAAASPAGDGKVIVLPTAAVKKEDDGEPKLSLPTESDRVAWTKSGFRLGLAFMLGDLHGIRGVPNASFLGVGLHAGIRLDKDWSLMTTFAYGRLAGGLGGLRAAGTVDPTWHVTRSLSLAVGFGFSAMVNARTKLPDADPLPGTLDSTYTFPSSTHPMSLCSGNGVTALARATYSWVIGPRASAFIEADAIGQYTECVDPTGNVDPDNAQPIVRIQFWAQDGFTVNGGFAWR
jgi:hypothetical protein